MIVGMMRWGFEGRELDAVPGSVFGFRRWAPSGGLLEGAYGRTWSPKPIHKAKCYQDPISTLVGSYFWHRVPVSECKCGYWAYWDAEFSEEPKLAIGGVIEGFGKTIIGSLGFRSEQCRIKALYSKYYDETLMGNLAAKYKVPVYTRLALMLQDHPLTRDYVNL